MSKRLTIVCSDNDSKKIFTDWEKYLSPPERSNWVFPRNSMVSMLWSKLWWDTKGKNIKKSTKPIQQFRNSVFSRVGILLKSWELSSPWNFLKERNEIFQMQLNVLYNLWLMFCCNQQKVQKMGHFWHFSDHKSESNHDDQTNDRIFLIYFLNFIRWYISFFYFNTFKVQVMGSLLCILFCSLKYIFTCQRWHFKAN